MPTIPTIVSAASTAALSLHVALPILYSRAVGSGGGYQAFFSGSYSLTTAALGTCTSTSWTPDHPSPQPPGTLIFFSVSATGCTQESQMQVVPPSGSSYYMAGGQWTPG